MASLSTNTETSSSQPQSATPALGTIFHMFPRLLPEVRRLIWLQYLEGVSPQLFRFNVTVPQYQYVGHHGYQPRRPRMRKGYQAILVPSACRLRGDEKRSLQQFLAITAASRTASATCFEARQVVLELLPDTLQFRILPRGLNDDEWPGSHPLDKKIFPEYTLRFNGARDIVIFTCLNMEYQEDLVDVINYNGGPPQGFLKMQHVGLTRFKSTAAGGSRGYGPSSEDCSCGGWAPTAPACEDSKDCCKNEVLLEFLALFPRLTTFYVAHVRELNYDDLSMMDRLLCSEPRPEESDTCQCPKNPDDSPRHSWPVIAAPDIRGWFVHYDERSGCIMPQDGTSVDAIRREWRPHFPYYKALEHLEIRFLRRFFAGPGDPWQFSM